MDMVEESMEEFEVFDGGDDVVGEEAGEQVHDESPTELAADAQMRLN